MQHSVYSEIMRNVRTMPVSGLEDCGHGMYINFNASLRQATFLHKSSRNKGRVFDGVDHSFSVTYTGQPLVGTLKGFSTELLTCGVSYEITNLMYAASVTILSILFIYPKELRL